jgi:FIMAH domain-containing protein
MKRLLVALALLAALGIVRPQHVLADSMDSCMQPGIQGLTMCVQHCAAEGQIANQGVTQSLLSKFNAAQTALDRRQTYVAVNELQAFVQEVQAQAGKQIAAEHAQHMVMHAEMVIEALQAP